MGVAGDTFVKAKMTFFGDPLIIFGKYNGFLANFLNHVEVFFMVGNSSWVSGRVLGGFPFCEV